jgi:hypothetical protein
MDGRGGGGGGMRTFILEVTEGQKAITEIAL